MTPSDAPTWASEESTVPVLHPVPTAARAVLAIPGFNPAFFNVPFILQLITNGLANGAIYALMALSVVIVYRTTGHLNFAQGEMATVGAFLVFALAVEHEVPYGLAVPGVIIVSMAAGALIERGLVRPVERRSDLAVVIVTLGLFLVLNAVTAAVWGTGAVTATRLFPGASGDQFVILDGSPRFFVRYSTIGIWVTLALVVTALWWLLQRTRLGLSYRAVGSNRESSLLVGIPVGRMLMLGWALSAGIGSLAAVLVANKGGSMDFNLMATVLLYGFTAAALGGFDSITGAVVGGMIVGLAEALIPQLFSFVGTELSLVMALVVITVVLLVRPQGLFGARRMERV
jgi:branched-chain amino acid transport system permease protein